MSDSTYENGPTATLWRDGRPVYDRGETVCVIGAGVSGLTAVKNLRESGFGVDCYERETSVGGAWNWRHDRSPVYASTHLISSKPFTQYPDFPMPDSWPDYPHHSQMLAYLERYADHFDLRQHIWFGTEVVRVEPAEEERWDVTTRFARGGTERTHRYAAVIVANGHNWSPFRPEIEGVDDYKGQVLHASAYKEPAPLRGKRVLVIGGGNTGCDIAVEAAQHAARCWHSTRRGYWYVPKYLGGRPADQVRDRLYRWGLPLPLRQWLAQRALRDAVGDLTRFGLPAPDHKILETHPIANSHLVYHIGHGAIEPVPDVARFSRTAVELVGGREIDPEVVVFATGYRPTFEFLAPELVETEADGRPRLYLHAFPRRHPTLAVVGLVQSASGLGALVHWQAVLVARWLRMREAEPARAADFRKRVQAGAAHRWTSVKAVDSVRHWFEIDHVEYLRTVQAALDELEPAR